MNYRNFEHVKQNKKFNTRVPLADCICLFVCLLPKRMYSNKKCWALASIYLFDIEYTVGAAHHRRARA
jgi:hypothetical protein